MVAGMTREQVLARPVAGKWSTLELVAHIADFDPILADRMKRIISLPETTIVAADENLFVKELFYHDREMSEELGLIEMTRASMARIIEKLTPEQLAKTAIHPVKGTVVLESVIQMMIRHINNNLPFLVAKKQALGIA